MHELIIDNFAGGGGASTGIEQALGRPIDIAINHDPVAIAMYKINHPGTRLLCESVWDVNPLEVTGGRPVALCWLSPDCKHFSKAKGGKPVEKHIRGLAWVAVRWAATVKPRIIMLENVEEFRQWGPLLEGKPHPAKKGHTFQAFVNALKRQGYEVQWRELRACDYGAPTSRKRLFLIARCDSMPIVWPAATHGDPVSAGVKAGTLLPWRTAAEIIDWSLPCPSIFERKKPLAENTLRRIARGIKKFVIDNPDPFIVKVNHHGEGFRGQKITEPLRTVTAKNGWGIAVPYITRIGHTGFGTDRMQYSIHKPLTTITSKAEHLLVTPFIAKHFGGGYQGSGAGLTQPLPTVTSVDHNALVTSHLVKLRGTCQHGQPVTDPLPTITAGGLHIGEVRAFLLKYYGTNVGHGCNDPIQTITAKHRFGLVTVKGVNYHIVDIGMRMLEPHELYAGNGFPADYIIDHDAEGNRFSKAVQVAKCGNSVPPPFSRALVLANMCGEEHQSTIAMEG